MAEALGLTVGIICLGKFLVWLGELREDWEESLPKRVSVFFFYHGRTGDC